MNALRYILINVVGTLLRMFPLPCKTGLIRLGHPDRRSPVLLTCNYVLTVERVKKALQGIDAYLLVANSRGINVWCAATGGLLTHHDVISALKTSGVEDLVDHREVILPQLAATGIEAQLVRERTGWHAIWGPVYAQDVPAFLEARGQKTPAMRQVTFGWGQRIEMAVAWGFPISVVAAVLLLLLWREATLTVLFLIWGASLLTFGAFPLYGRWLAPERKRVAKIGLGVEHGVVPLALWSACLLGLLLFGTLSGNLTWGWGVRWGLVSLLVVVVVNVDLTGSTPVYKSSLHADRGFKIVIDPERCHGDGFCEQVCPRNCFSVDRPRHTMTMPGAERCVRCGACIVQCPHDALCFRNAKGQMISPQTIRRYKLNLMGKRQAGD